jgi:cytoskeleton protein RodZ
MTESPMTNLGLRLREQREKKGYSIRDIADKTKIPLQVLEGLESGDHSFLPAPVFVKGFLRSYAREIGLSPEEVLAEYNQQTTRPEPGVMVPITARDGLARRTKVRRTLLYTIGIMVLLVVAVGTLFPDLKDGSLRPIWSAATGHDSGIEPVTSGAEPSVKEPEPVETVEAPPVTPTPPAAAEPPAEEPATVPVVAEKPAPLSVREGPHTLELLFDQQVWLQIKSDDGEMQHGLFPAGTSKTYSANERFELRLGNAGGVRVMFDGEDLGPIGRPGQAVNLVLPNEGG